MKSSTGIGGKLLAGAVAGIAGAFVMNQLQGLWRAVSKEMRRRKGESPQPSQGGEANATVKTAREIGWQILDHQVTPAEEKWAGPAVHYAFGALMGSLYAGLADAVPGVDSANGMAYGAAVWLVADEYAVPKLDLSKPPSETPASAHAQALAAHLVYGLTTDLISKALIAHS